MSFDKKFGADFLSSVPTAPGVYRFYADDSLQYVGKAVSLRRRLQQYRNAGRKKKDRKHRSIVKASNRISFEVCTSEEEALLLENEIIRTEKPRLNVSGAFSFMYPCVGLRENREHLFSIVYSTNPEDLSDYTLFGSFRSKPIVRPAFEALEHLLSSVGHPERDGLSPPYSSVRSFRRVPENIKLALPKFLLGDSDELLQLVILELLERRSARAEAEVVQSALDSLALFYREEVLTLRDAKLATQSCESFIAQENRDALFISAKAGIGE